MIKGGLAFLLGSLSSAIVFGASKPSKVQELSINNFSRGVDTYHDSTILQDGYVQDALNVYFDRQAPVEKRQGYSTAFSSKSYSYNTAWAYTDGNNVSWLIVRASDTIIASDLAGTIVKISTVSANDNVDETNAFGKAYFVDPTQGVYTWDGAVTTYVPNSPHGSIITQFHSRVFVAGLAVPNGNQLYGSKFLDGTVWTVGLNPNDPVQFTIGLQDNYDNITALYPFLDTLYIPKYTSIYGLYGYDLTSFQNSILTRECGCVDKYSMQSFNKGIIFVSLRGLEYYDGYNCNRISDPIKNKIDPAIQLTSFNQNSWVQQNPNDWVAGTLNPTINLSTAIASPGLTISSFQVVENSTAQWNLGTISVGIDTSTPNVLQLKKYVIEPFSSLSRWAVTSGTPTVSPLSCPAITGTCNLVASSTFSDTIGDSVLQFDIKQASCTLGDVFGASFENNTEGYGINILTLSGSTHTIDMGRMTIPSSGYTVSSATSTTVLCDANWHTAKIIHDNLSKRTTFYWDGANVINTANDPTEASGPSAPFNKVKIQMVNQAPGFPALIRNLFFLAREGNVTSQTYDTNLSSPIIQFQSVFYTSGTAPSFSLLTSTNSAGPYVPIMTSTGTNAFGYRYVKYSSSFTNTATDVTLSTISSVSIIARSTGAFKSQIHNVGAVNSWGNFSVTEALNSGNIAFSLCSSANSNMSAPNCAAQPVNSQIVISTGTYVQVYATFTVTAATQTPVLNSFTVQWFSGAKANPMASVVYDNRYWLSVTTSTVDSTNDAVIVMNPSMAFTLFDIHAGGLVVIKNNLYHSDSNASGNIYLDNQGYNDNGSAIASYIRTRDYNLGSRIADTLFDSLWPSVSNLGDFNVGVKYALDKGAVDYNLATINQNEFANSKFVRVPFPMSVMNPNVAQTINFKVIADQVNEPWQLQEIGLLYHERAIQE